MFLIAMMAGAGTWDQDYFKTVTEQWGDNVIVEMQVLDGS
jgi:hypothetical protein